ncbi:hypothetical protein [Celeribacter sp. SCSIO 80788]|uniref:hypothetical protein n=1 Tax=Celeribacter sp. SCSIO 80788 TaxID=3117013 RepID=UPI003DA64A79
MSEALKPCPFCGAKPHTGLSKVLYDQIHGEPFQNTIIKCPHLCASMQGSDDTVRNRWNDRHTRADLTESRLRQVAEAVWEESVLVAMNAHRGSVGQGDGATVIAGTAHDAAKAIRNIDIDAIVRKVMEG